jgi:hypothetical protein
MLMMLTDFKMTTVATFASRIVEDPNLVDYVEDWSRCRSPSRARRRLKRGFPQNVTMRPVPRQQVYSYDNGRMLVMRPRWSGRSTPQFGRGCDGREFRDRMDPGDLESDRRMLDPLAWLHQLLRDEDGRADPEDEPNRRLGLRLRQPL